MGSSLLEVTRQMLQDRGVDLTQYVEDRRAAGASWRRITSELAVVSEGTLHIDHQTLRRWFPAAADDDTTAA